MKRLAAFIVCLCLLCFPVRAEDEKLVALTFDDGPSGRFTRQLLEGLEKRNANATFFLCGYRMEQYPNLTEAIFRDGHEIGLHGYSHKSMENMCQQEILQELEKTIALLPEECTVSFLRTPGGLWGNCAGPAAEKLGLSLLSWSVDPKDWSCKDPAAIEKAVVSRVRDGDVILMHDMSHSSVKAALAIVDKLQAQGYRFVTVSQLAKARGIDPAAGTVYTHF